METCISCKERPIEIKKWRRCIRCYQRYRKGVGGRLNQPEIQHQREMDFIRNFFKHNNWTYQPANFSLRWFGGNYTPDFYDGERNVFMEIAGTRQAFTQNKAKYKKFIRAYPKINFEIRYVTGELLTDMKFHIPSRRKV